MGSSNIKNGKSLAAWVGTGITVAALIVAITVTVTSKADQGDVTAACTRISVVEREQTNQKDDLREIKLKVDKIYDMLLEDRRMGP